MRRADPTTRQAHAAELEAMLAPPPPARALARTEGPAGNVVPINTGIVLPPRVPPANTADLRRSQGQQVPGLVRDMLAKVAADLLQARSSEDVIRLAENFKIIAANLLEGGALVTQFEVMFANARMNVAKAEAAKAEYEARTATIERERQRADATHSYRVQGAAAGAKRKAVIVERELAKEQARSADTKPLIATDERSVRNRAFARNTLAEALAGNLTADDNNYYRAFARLLYDDSLRGRDHDRACELVVNILVNEMQWGLSFETAYRTYLDLFVEKRRGIERDVTMDRELALQRIEADKERARAEYMHDLKSVAGGSGYDPAS